MCMGVMVCEHFTLQSALIHGSSTFIINWKVVIFGEIGSGEKLLAVALYSSKFPIPKLKGTRSY
jgi:hypothetical protein